MGKGGKMNGVGGISRARSSRASSAFPPSRLSLCFVYTRVLLATFIFLPHPPASDARRDTARRMISRAYSRLPGERPTRVYLPLRPSRRGKCADLAT